MFLPVWCYIIDTSNFFPIKLNFISFCVRKQKHKRPIGLPPFVIITSFSLIIDLLSPAVTTKEVSIPINPNPSLIVLPFFTETPVTHHVNAVSRQFLHFPDGIPDSNRRGPSVHLLLLLHSSARDCLGSPVIVWSPLFESQTQ